MSKERARRRAEREVARAAAIARNERRLRRRAARRALLRRLTPRQRRRGSLAARRTPGQRAFVAGTALAALIAIWYFVEPLALRIAFSLLLVLLLPVLVVVTFDRRL